MKLLHIINDLRSGGAEKILQDIVGLQTKQGMSVDVLLLSDKGNVFTLNEKANNVFIINKGIYNIVNIFEIRKYLKKDYDIIHSHLFPTQYYVALASLFLKQKPKLVFTEHSTSNRRRKHKIFIPIEKYIYSRYDNIICITQQVKNYLLNWIGKKNNKFVVIENGIILENFTKAKALELKGISKSLKTTDVLFMMVARFTSEKDHETVLRALSELPVHYKLLLVGEGVLKNEVEERVQELNLKKRVFFLGFRNDIARLMKSVDINLLSSHWEGFGLVCVEAMACKKPFIASDVDGMREVVKGAGILFEKKNVNDLVKKILSLMNDKKYYDEVSKKCFERAQKFSLKITSEKYYELYKSLLVDN